MSDWVQLPFEASQWDRAVWQRLERALGERGDPMRLPVLGSVDAQGKPYARTLVLRGVDSAARSLEAYADARSPKVAHVRAQPETQWVFFDPAESLQLRVRACVHVEMGPDARRHFAALPEFARRDYAGIAAPGAAASGPASAPGSPAEAEPMLDLARAEANFCLLRGLVHEVDALALHPSGHVRRHLDYRDGAFAVTKLVP